MASYAWLRKKMLYFPLEVDKRDSAMECRLAVFTVVMELTRVFLCYEGLLDSKSKTPV